MPIHPTAIIDPTAEVDASTDIGPFCVITGPARIGPDNVLLANTYVSGDVTLGRGNRIGPFVCLGTDPQDRRVPDESGVVIGDDNIIREFAQVHRSIYEGQLTRMGDRCMIMSKGHVAHDCVIGDDAYISNGAHLSGHVQIGDRAFISSPVGVHQFVRIGRLAYISALSGVGLDVPPFTIVEGRNRVRGLNVVGMRRADIDAVGRKDVKRVYKELYHSGRTLSDAIKAIDLESFGPHGREVIEFCRAKSKRGIMRHARSSRPGKPQIDD